MWVCDKIFHALGIQFGYRYLTGKHMQNWRKTGKIEWLSESSNQRLDGSGNQIDWQVWLSNR